MILEETAEILDARADGAGLIKTIETTLGQTAGVIPMWGHAIPRVEENVYILIIMEYWEFLLHL